MDPCFREHEAANDCWCYPVEVEENLWLHWSVAPATSRTVYWLYDFLADPEVVHDAG